MNSRYQTEDDLHDLRDSRGEDREISLGTTTILGIFFALALLCAVFFGFGYSLGRRSAPPVLNAAETTTPGGEPGSSKPAPGSPAQRAAATSPVTQADTNEALAASDTPAPSVDENPPVTAQVRAVASSFHPDARVEPTVKPVAKVAAAAPMPLVGPGVAVVQVAAVSHQEDADVLVSALKRRGYSVAIHKVPQDKLLHVQIGPFTTKKDADAMRQRLQTDGYNAIVK
ncbi:SPOR domain-containing protein [Granulicella sp. S190]|uniref:SPOR domain-containing protein n=1 Tax=Granulicella sp. S190 TaxID=1747226 RepID=UPI00131DBD2F|nr:SPOR domain-containing protein [Granulicella sp. S190]